ncbi:hypothetical protein GWK08_03770 [Leptobacterium flavescens]|uniref:DUF1579 domain-containing protein n=1 Tax=Leptobacterium flavescens TaxID=472055 RepID=A0A6P0UQ79_9FLAO|nr:hypothetical protein [Leptobacterium flavescens]NER12546.1 hypothetical protein [Leptobacterium flavescens]
MKQVYRFLLILFLLPLCMSGQETSGFFEKIKGEWKGEGNLFGTEASFYMNWKTELEGKFMTLDFKNKFKTGEGTVREMKAKAFYTLKEEVKGYWLDSRGVMLPLKGNRQADKMLIYWGDDGSTEKGKTEYSIVSDNKVEVKDYVFRDEKYVPFGHAVYQKLEKE